MRRVSVSRVAAAETAPVLPGVIVEAHWLMAHLEHPLVVIDATVVLSPPESDGDYRAESGVARYLEGHVPGARHADLLHGLSEGEAAYHFARPAPHQLADGLEALGVVDGRPVVAYDSEGGIWAARLWWMLRAIGVPAAVLDGGWSAWVAAGGPVETGPPGELPAHLSGAKLTVAEHEEMWMEQAGVIGIVGGSRPGSLVCALPPESFAGSVPTRYRRRGHIPTSLNVPARGLVGPDGLLLGPDDLSLALANVPEESSPVVVYCGGGISAAAVALALVKTGRDDVAVYDGSLEEWAADPALPLELGPEPR